MLNLRNRDNGDGRREEVKEVLDSNLDAYRRVFNLEKDWVSTFQESIKPNEQANTESIESSQKQTEKVVDILTEKINILETINKKITSVPNPSINSQEISKRNENLTKLTNSADFIRFYNELMRNLLNSSNSQQTKEGIKNNISSLSPLINKINFEFDYLIYNSFFKNIDAGGDFTILSSDEYDALTSARKKTYDKQLKFLNDFLMRVLGSYSIYSFVQKSLFRNNFNVIQQNDINNIYSSLYGDLSSDPRIKLIIDTIKDDDNETKAQQNAMEKREKLIREDQGLPLSPEQINNLRNTIFGAPNRTVPLTPEELEQMAFFSEERQKEIEEKTKQTENRIAIGLPPVDFEPEIPAPYYGDYKGEFKTEDEIRKIFTDYRKKININAVFLKNNLTAPTADMVRDRIRDFRKKKYDYYYNFHKLLFGNNPTQDENYIVGTVSPSLSDANIISPYFKTTVAKRATIRNDIDKLVEYYLSEANDKLLDDFIKTYNPKPIVGQGKPRFSAFFNPLYYNDENNDDYLIH
jgi:hypothetical protein